MEEQNQHAHCGHCESHGETHAAPATAPVSDLEALKKEINTNLNSPAVHRDLPWGSLIISVVLGLLALISIAQAAQTALIYNKMKSGDFKASGSAANQTQNLPNMVGGC